MNLGRGGVNHLLFSKLLSDINQLMPKAVSSHLYQVSLRSKIVCILYSSYLHSIASMLLPCMQPFHCQSLRTRRCDTMSCMLARPMRQHHLQCCSLRLEFTDKAIAANRVTMSLYFSLATLLRCRLKAWVMVKHQSKLDAIDFQHTSAC